MLVDDQHALSMCLEQERKTSRQGGFTDTQRDISREH